jgi:hypothetical protein
MLFFNFAQANLITVVVMVATIRVTETMAVAGLLDTADIIRDTIRDTVTIKDTTARIPIINSRDTTAEDPPTTTVNLYYYDIHFEYDKLYTLRLLQCCTPLLLSLLNLFFHHISKPIHNCPYIIIRLNQNTQKTRR